MGFRTSFYADGRVRWFLINLAASFYTRNVSITNVTRRTRCNQCFAPVSSAFDSFTINVSAPRSNLLRDGEPSDDNVDRSDRGYVPVQPLAYDHGVSLIPLSSLPDSDDFTTGHHELQVRNGLPGSESRRARGRWTPSAGAETVVRRAENGPKTAAWIKIAPPCVSDHAPRYNGRALGRRGGRQPVRPSVSAAGKELLDVDVAQGHVERAEAQLVRAVRLFVEVRLWKLHTQLAAQPAVRQLHVGRG